MRSSLLDPLFTPLSRLSGIGEKTAPLYEKLIGRRDLKIFDLLLHLPNGIINRQMSSTLRDAPVEGIITVAVTIDQYRPPPIGRAKAPFRVLASDETADLTLVFFRHYPGQIEKSLPLGAVKVVSGRVELYDGMRQMQHPDRILNLEEAESLPPLEPSYPLTEGITNRRLLTIIPKALRALPQLPEWQEPNWLIKNKFPAFHEAFLQLHRGESAQDVSSIIKVPNDAPFATAPDTETPPPFAYSPARRRLAYDELLADQLALVLIRKHQSRSSGRVSIGTGECAKKIIAALPFTLTNAQEKALAEIRADLAAPEKMLRLLQGDVGSGKTIVAFLAIATMVESGRQCALMVPTEILARQHYARLLPLCEVAGIRPALLTGRSKSAERIEIHRKLQNGEIDLLIGTHALFQDDVIFKDLGLAIIDEQHRFGVSQRLALGKKGADTDLLVMTATPIPRTLVLTHYGDMQVSLLNDKPFGRLPIDTRLINMERLDETIASLGRALSQGTQAYWICPLVEESEFLDLSAASARFTELQSIFGDQVALIHGQMNGADKDAAMEGFQTGKTRLLVSTTVVEVGVDVPNATIMVIEHAERFGLAQLHQLRGRVGRGTARSTCLLLYKAPLGKNSEARLKMMRETEDGFRLAEEDLRLRGEGDILGTRQSGLPDFRIANLETDQDLLYAARDDAELIIRSDSVLQSVRGHALRDLLCLFQRDDAVRLLRAG